MSLFLSKVCETWDHCPKFVRHEQVVPYMFLTVLYLALAHPHTVMGGLLHSFHGFPLLIGQCSVPANLSYGSIMKPKFFPPSFPPSLLSFSFLLQFPLLPLLLVRPPLFHSAPPIQSSFISIQKRGSLRFNPLHSTLSGYSKQFLYLESCFTLCILCWNRNHGKTNKSEERRGGWQILSPSPLPPPASGSKLV